MTQNLDYDIEANLSVETSDVESDIFGLTVTRYAVNGVGGWGEDNAALKYYDPGLLAYTRPTETNNCGNVTKLSDCAGYGWKEYHGGKSENEHYLVGNFYYGLRQLRGLGIV